MIHFQRAIYFVGGDVIETFAFVFFGQAFPIEFRSLQQTQRSHHVGFGESERIFDTAVYVAFSRQMDDAIHLFVLHQLIKGLKIADVHFHELIVGLVFYILEIGQITCVGQFIQVDNLVVGILVHKQSDHVTANKSGASGNDDASFAIHICIVLIMNTLFCSLYAILPCSILCCFK